jgi:alkanesulfonate monooxygenase SsuD/methylene tetrahydromethanopterin reductase-like flavin-dependent oxidoreductase (luciferase family)
MGYRSPGTSTRELLEEATVLTEIADQGGLGMSWFAEHHFSNYGICPSPLLMATYCAPRTKQIKLATGILVLPLYQPARLLSEIAMVDALTEGRLVLGIGTGYQPFEFERFGADLSQAKSVFEEFVELIEGGLSDEFVESKGRHLHLPRTHIGPRPFAGKPEIWVAGHAPEVHRVAAKRGYPMIVNGRFSPIDEVAGHRTKLEHVLSDAHVRPETLHWGLLRYCCVTESKDEARDYVENARWQLRVATSLRHREEHQSGHMILGDRPLKDEPSIDAILDSQMIGDVETCIARGVEEIRKTGVNHISLYFQLGDYAHRKARRSLERFIGEVIPGIEKEIGPLSKVPTKPFAGRGAAA